MAERAEAVMEEVMKVVAMEEASVVATVGVTAEVTEAAREGVEMAEVETAEGRVVVMAVAVREEVVMGLVKAEVTAAVATAAVATEEEKVVDLVVAKVEATEVVMVEATEEV